jgi:hypothetical protein
VQPPSNPRTPWYALAASLLICFGIWRWAETILLPSNTKVAQSKQIPIGNNSDLYPRWLGARESLLHGRDPYSREMTSEMQAGFYGRPLDPKNPSDPKDQVGFAYPLYVIFLLAPTVTLPFPTVLKIFQWLLTMSLAGCVPLWMSAVEFHTGPAFKAVGMLLAVSCYPAVSEYHLQNLAVLVVLMLAAASAAAVRGWLVLAGFILALSTIKPQLSALFILFFMLWTAGQWKTRQRLFYSFFASLLALVLAAEAVSPGWVGRFLTAIRGYQTYAADPSILQVLLPTWLARLLAVALVGFLILRLWQWRRGPAGGEQFGWALAWTAAVTLAVIPKLAAYNQPLLIPALLVLLANRKTIWKARLLPRALAKGVLMCLLWQWGAALVLALASLLVPPSRLQPAAGVPEYTLLALPPITLLAVLASAGASVRARSALPRTAG